jgi:hypothetical protein
MATAYTLISSVVVGSGGTSSISFNSIPNTYTDLSLVLSTRSAANSSVQDLKMYFNSTGNNSNMYLMGNGSTASSGNSVYTPTYNWPGVSPAATSTANTFSNISIYIPNYTSSDSKSFSIDAVQEDNTSTAYSVLVAGLWSSSSAITDINIIPASLTIVQHSTAYLYGISNA